MSDDANKRQILFNQARRNLLNLNLKLLLANSMAQKSVDVRYSLESKLTQDPVEQNKNRMKYLQQKEKLLYYQKITEESLGLGNTQHNE